MESIIYGIGNELFVFFIAYISIFITILCLTGFNTNCVQNINHLWIYVKSIFRRQNSGNRSSEEEQDPSEDQPVDIRVFNTGCCVCLNDDCEYPVTSTCGHCFCGICAMNLIDHNSVPIKCPFCRQECRTLLLPPFDARDMTNNILSSIIRSVTTYNTRVGHRIPFFNRIRDVPIIIRHLVGSFAAFHGRLIFRLKCHIIAALLFAPFYFILSTDIIPESVFGLVGFIDDILVFVLLTTLIARTYTNLNSSMTFNDIRAAME